MVLRLWRFAAALFLVAAASASAQQPADMVRAWELSRGEERILSYVSAVTVERDGDLDVTETIRLVSLRQTINHGIQRDFPTTYWTAAGQKTKVGFEVVSVQRDGQDEPWERLSLSNGARIRIGSADVTLPIGEHTFVIRYRTTRQIHYGKASDELYWNVTGTGWTFPIDLAEAHITLPTQAQFGNRAVYTGPQGATGRDAEVAAERPGYIAFRTTKPLGREEGLTIATAFPKGVLDEPGPGERAAWWLEDWGALATAILGSLGVAFYYLRAWWKVGRGPRAGTVVPIFAPPEGLSAAAIRFVTRMGMDNRAFSAAMVDLGVRGKLHITQEEGGWLSKGTTTLSRAELPRPGFDTSLPEPERAMREKLFSGGDSLELKQANHARLQGARTALEKGLAAAYEGTMFVKNRDWAFYGLFLILLAMLAASAVALFFTTIYPWHIKLGVPLAAALLLAAAFKLKRPTGRTVSAMGCLRMLGVGLLAFAGLGAAFGTVMSALSINPVAVLLPLITLPLALTAFLWIDAPTPAGRTVMDRIAGFKQYLSITEESRLDALHPPEKTPELFERYLPYAIALDVENRWAERFAGVLAAAAASGAAAGTAAWYSGHGNMWDDPGRFASDVGSSLASTVSSAATSPSSSGGSSGGGSSGGGGGGGGGSGW